MSQFAGWSLGLPVTSISQSVPGMGQDGRESAWTSRVSCEFDGSRHPFERWLRFSDVQNDPSAEVTEQFSSAEQELGSGGLKSAPQTSVVILD